MGGELQKQNFHPSAGHGSMEGNHHHRDRSMPRRLCLIASLLLMFVAPDLSWAESSPGQFDYYLLSLSWSPQYCGDHSADPDNAEQCVTHPRGFVAHGLWPQNAEGGWPASCRPSIPLPPALISQMIPIMPSQRLIQHEWDKHGSCSGLSAEDYFTQVGDAFRKVQIPPALQAPHSQVTASVARIKQMFAEANPGLSDKMIIVKCVGKKRIVSDVRFCMDRKSLAFRPCGPTKGDACLDGDVRFRPLD